MCFVSSKERQWTRFQEPHRQQQEQQQQQQHHQYTTRPGATSRDRAATVWGQTPTIWSAAYILAIVAIANRLELATRFPVFTALWMGWVLWKAMQRARHYRWGTVVVDCVHTVDDVMMRVSSSQTITRIKSSVLDFATRRETGQNPEKPSKTPVERRSPKITLAVPFLANETVALLGLSDLKDLMRLTMDVNRMDFNKHAFVSTLNEHCSRAVEGMYLATAASRGTNASISTAPIRERSSLAGDIDALVFVAFVRIFAEWRSLRLVPDGYQGYAVGMGLAKRDLIQNAHKLEVAVHKWMENNEESRRTSSGLAFGHQSSSPTLKQLLTWERDANIHPRLPKVTDKSGASALLWIHRQLKYQTTIFRNLARVPSEFPTGKDAVAAAYDSVYNEYHGFIVKRIFRTSFDAAPGADEILFHMNRGACEIRRSDSTDSEDLTEGMTTDDDSIVNLKGSDSVSNAASVFRESSSSTMSMNPKNPLEQFSDHIANEWMKLESFMKQCNGAHADSDKSRNALAGPTSSIINLMDLTSIKQRSATATAAEEDISSFIAVIQPFLDGIDKMIDHFNMNDPSKC